MRALLSAFLLTALALCAADVSGKWSGKADVKSGDGQTRAVELFFTFKQEGIRLTGSIGASEEEQLQIQKGAVEGDRVTFEVATQNGIGRFDLKAVEDRIEGEARRGGEVATIVMRRFTGRCQSAPQPAEAVPVLAAVRAIEREIAGGAKHAWQGNLRTAELLSGVVQQLSVSGVAETSGADRWEVTAPGCYQIKVHKIQPRRKM